MARRRKNRPPTTSPEPIKKALSLSMELGVSGLKKNYGQVRDEFLRELQGTKGVKTFREMSMNDPVIGGILLSIKNILRKMTWTEERVSERTEDQQNADFLKSCREDMSHSWGDFISSILSMLAYGWSLFEVVYKRRQGQDKDPASAFTDGRIGWRKFAVRAQETLHRWEFDKEGGLQAFVQQDPDTGKFIKIPIDKCLLFRTSTEKNSPEGLSLLRSAYIPWYRKKNFEIVEAIGIERDLAGLPTMGVPPEILQNNAPSDISGLKDDIIAMLSNIRNDEQGYVLYPLDYDENGSPKWKFELVASSGSRQFNTSEIVNRYDSRIAMSMLYDVILIGHENVGSFALSKNKMEMASQGVVAFADLIEDALNRFAVPGLFELNGIRADSLPKLRHGKVGKLNLAEIGEFLQKITGSGAALFPNEELENFLLEEAELPRLPEGGIQPPGIDREMDQEDLRTFED